MSNEMAKSTKSKQSTKQLTLLDVAEQEESRCPLRVWSTEFFQIKVPQDAFIDFEEKLDEVKNNGQHRFNVAEKRMAMLKFIQTKMKPRYPLQNITGEQYYLSKASFMKQLFAHDLELTVSL